MRRHSTCTDTWACRCTHPRCHITPPGPDLELYALVQSVALSGPDSQDVAHNARCRPSDSRCISKAIACNRCFDHMRATLSMPHVLKTCKSHVVHSTHDHSTYSTHDHVAHSTRCTHFNHFTNDHGLRGTPPALTHPPLPLHC
jgi:hypothetical protein